MTVAWVAGFAMLLAAAVLLVYAARALLLRRTAVLVGRTIVVHTRQPDDRSIRGTIYGDLPESGWVVLNSAEYLRLEGAASAGGIVRVPVIGISSVQDFEPTSEKPVTP